MFVSFLRQQEMNPKKYLVIIFNRLSKLCWLDKRQIYKCGAAKEQFQWSANMYVKVLLKNIRQNIEQQTHHWKKLTTNVKLLSQILMIFKLLFFSKSTLTEKIIKHPTYGHFVFCLSTMYLPRIILPNDSLK